MKKLTLLMLLCLMGIGLKAQVANPLEILEINYNSGDTYSFENTGGAVIFKFNREITTTGFSIITPSNTKVEITEVNTANLIPYGYYLYLQLGTQMKTLLSEGTIKKGDTFKVVIEGVKDASDASISYGEDGTASISLVAPRSPAKFVSVNKPTGSKIKSYYEPGDADAKVIYTFSEEVTCNDSFMTYGDIEKETYEKVALPVSYSGKDVTVDLGGIDLSPDKIKGNTNITITIKGTKTLDGVAVEGNIPNSSSVISSYDVENIVSNDVYGSFIDADIDAVSEISCFVSAPITLDGVLLKYKLGGQDASYMITDERITKKTEDAGMYLTIPLGLLSFDAGKVVAELVNAKTENGSAVQIDPFEYTSKGKTNVTTCLGVDPAQGKLSSAPLQYVISFNNTVTVESATYNIEGIQIPLVIPAQVVVNNNTITITNLRGEPAGDYGFTLKVKDANGYVTYGDVADNVTLNYSIPVDVFTCSTVDPKEGVVSSLKVFTLKFDEITTGTIIGGFDTAKPIVLKNEAGEVVATATLAEPDFNLNVVATLDKEITAAGKYTLHVPAMSIFNDLFDSSSEDFGVSFGAKYNPEINFTYTIGAVEPTTCVVSPAEGALTAVPASVVLTFSRKVTVETALAYTQPRMPGVDVMGQVTVENNVVTVNTSALEADSFMRLALTVKDETGAYVTVGDYEGLVSVMYEIVKPADRFICASATPAEGAVTSLKEFTLTFSNTDEPQDMIGGFDKTKEVVLKNAAGETVAKGTFGELSFDTPLSVVVTLDSEITTPGEYTLVVPEATVYNGMFDEYADDLGVSFGAIYNPEKTFAYTIADANPTTCVVTPTDGNVTEYPNEVVFTFSRNVTLDKALFSTNPYLPSTDIMDKVTVDKNVVKVNTTGLEIYTFLKVSLVVKDERGVYVSFG
ncbi:MAG: hypothetical protein PHR45_02670, partial [Muribaculaceae bacterium]|nr:hypothetical protein [Muribaculaceae bacterium]